jgi:hypothetical protein
MKSDRSTRVTPPGNELLITAPRAQDEVNQFASGDGTMPTSEPGANRHQLRVWLKWAIESGLLDRIPPQYDPDGSGDPQPTEDYARGLLAELKDPESSRRPLREILAEARQFRDWVEYRQKMSRRIILGRWDSEGAAARVPERLTPTRSDRTKRPARIEREDASARPHADPMWDDWLEG